MLRLASDNVAKEVIVIKTLFSTIIISLVLCFFLSPINSFAGHATLAWDPPDTPTDVTGYMIHYGTASGTYSQGIDVGNTTSYTVSNLIDGQTYYFAVTTYNAAGDESVDSNEVSMLATAINTTDDSGGGGGGDSGGGGGGGGGDSGGGGGGGSGAGCFIATAAYGSYLDPHVMVLREFRDKVLLKNKFGKMFVAFYYKNSPPIADRISKIEALRLATRLALTPVVYAMAYPSATAMLLLAALLILAIVVRRKKLARSTTLSAVDEYFQTTPRKGIVRVL